MLQRFLSWLVHKKPEPDDIVHEKWSTSFSIFKKRRFLEENGDGFRAFHHGGTFSLHLTRRNLFAWAMYGPYRYHNAVVEAKIGFDPGNGHCSAGLMVRYLSEENYYYALISNRGTFRFDVVLNGNPVCLIPWMDIDLPSGSGEFVLRIIIHNSSFSFYLNDSWIAELDDESIDSGYLAFCAQNYDERDSAGLQLHSMRIESRPVEVDIWYYRWTRFIPAPAERRIYFAERLNGHGQHAAALIQLRKAYRGSEPDARGYFLLSLTCLNLEMYDEALRNVEACLEAAPEHNEARLEKANILYLQNRFLDTKEYLSELKNDFQNYSNMWNLLGNAEYALGNWKEASEAYAQAAELEGEMPIYRINAARAYEKAGCSEQAVEQYAEAARLFFRQEAFDDLPPIFERMRQIAPRNRIYRTVRGKVLFGEARYEEAEELFLSLIRDREAESEIYFLEGLILTLKENPEAAREYFDRAVAENPDFYLYWLKKGENEYVLGKDPTDSLEKARTLQPDDGWVRNLAGLVHLERGELPKAGRELKEALRILPEEDEIKINLSEVIFHTEGINSAVAILDFRTGAAENQTGNLYARTGDLDSAIEHYRTAVQMMPENGIFRENLAAALWEAGLINEAEENLARLLEEAPGVRAYELIGHVAYEKGEYTRAVAAWNAALEITPDSDHLKLLYAQGLMHAGDIRKAEKTAEGLLEGPEKDEAAALLRRIRELTHQRYVCDECGREWWAPRDIRKQSTLKLVGEPPEEMPAGKCRKCGRVFCVGCASKYLKNSRFTCPHCEEGLKLNENGLKYLALQYVELEKKQ